ncbi:cation efflux family-domain-containing protein [Biscogniauxia mediterranea]|nr:cation efflux family-domain-containing protein [Biscogniauxia mediterranea]
MARATLAPPPVSIEPTTSTSTSTPIIRTPASDPDSDSDEHDDRIDLDCLPHPPSANSSLLMPYDPNRLSPMTASFHPNPNPNLPSPNMASSRTHTDAAADPLDIPAVKAPNPFNFQTQVISSGPVKPSVGQRRGHKYKHSSISAQHHIFQEPPPRPPLALPRDLPVPTVREAWKSMSIDQRRRLYWCICHLVIACIVFLSAHGSLAMTALSHLVFFDVGSALICVAVEVLGNFEVWKRSSLRHPFGLERAEVLAGFALSVFLIFGGFDLVSHNLKHVLEDQGHHAPHHPDPHEGLEPRVAMGSLDMPSLAAIAASLVSAYGLRNHARISKLMRVSYLASLPSVLSNPFHFLTLGTSSLLVLLPLLSIPIHIILDSTICALVAVSMFVLGFRLAVAQGFMLLMSYSGRSSTSATFNSNSNSKGGGGINSRELGVSDIVREIEEEPSVARVEEAQFWQVHYGLCMANLKLCVTSGCDDAALSRLRLRVSSLIQNRLGEGYGKGGSLRWEVNLEMRS